MPGPRFVSCPWRRGSVRFLAPQERTHFGITLGEIDRIDFNAFRAVILRDFIDARQSGDAGRAPCGPEIQHDDVFAAMGGDVQRPAFEQRQRELRRYFANCGRRQGRTARWAFLRLRAPRLSESQDFLHAFRRIETECRFGDGIV